MTVSPAVLLYLCMLKCALPVSTWMTSSHIPKVELYDHAGDDGSSFDAFENENLAYMPEYAALVQELSGALRLGWRAAIPKHLFPPQAQKQAHAQERAVPWLDPLVADQCDSDLGCSLNGVCTSDGKCQCDKPWTGPSCGVLAFKPSKLLQSLVPRTIAKSSWGGSIIEAGGQFHLYANSITSVVNITKGLIVHGTSGSIDGPYVKTQNPNKQTQTNKPQIQLLTTPWNFLSSLSTVVQLEFPCQPLASPEMPLPTVHLECSR